MKKIKLVTFLQILCCITLMPCYAQMIYYIWQDMGSIAWNIIITILLGILISLCIVMIWVSIGIVKGFKKRNKRDDN